MIDAQLRDESSQLLPKHFEYQPSAVVLCCGGGGNILAAEGILDVKVAIEADWRGLECARFNLGDGCPRLIRSFHRQNQRSPETPLAKFHISLVSSSFCEQLRSRDSECCLFAIAVLSFIGTCKYSWSF